MSQQHELLRHFHGVYMRMFNANGPSAAEEADATDLGNAVLSEDRLYSVKLSDVEVALEDLGQFLLSKIEETVTDLMTALVKYLSVCTVNLIASVIYVVAERDSSKDAAADMPPVLPHQILSLRRREFSSILKVQTPRLSHRMSTAGIDIIGQQFQELQSVYYRESSLKVVLDACDRRTSFKDAWKLTQDRLPSL